MAALLLKAPSVIQLRAERLSLTGSVVEQPQVRSFGASRRCSPSLLYCRRGFHSWRACLAQFCTGLRKIVHVNGGFVWAEMRAPPPDLKASMVRSADWLCSFRRMMLAGKAPPASASSPSKLQSTKGGESLNNRSAFVISSVTLMDARISLRKASVRGSKRVPSCVQYGPIANSQK